MTLIFRELQMSREKRETVAMQLKEMSDVIIFY